MEIAAKWLSKASVRTCKPSLTLPILGEYCILRFRLGHRLVKSLNSIEHSLYSRVESEREKRD